MISYILLAFLPLVYSLSINHNNFKPYYVNNKPYSTPQWVYKNVYDHNKKYNKITRKMKNNNISFNDEYHLIKYYKLPFGLLQPITYY